MAENKNRRNLRTPTPNTLNQLQYNGYNQHDDDDEEENRSNYNTNSDSDNRHYGGNDYEKDYEKDNNNAMSSSQTNNTTSHSKPKPKPKSQPNSKPRKIDFTTLKSTSKKLSANSPMGSPMVESRRMNVDGGHAYPFPSHAAMGALDDGDVDMDDSSAVSREVGRGLGRREGEKEREAQAQNQRMQLISPPPEEVLMIQRRVSGGSVRLHGHGTPGGVSASATTPAKTSGSGSSSKRKRAQAQAQQGHGHGATTGAFSTVMPANAEEQPQSFDAAQPVEATPNPKPRKQRHVRTQSVDSPTKGKFASGRARHDDDAEEEEDLTTMASNANARTPTKPKKKVVIQSPHVKNPDADWIPQIVLSAGSSRAGSDSASPPQGQAQAQNPSVRRLALSARGSRRSATPIPPYEPPSDVFTPPREVFISPPGQGRSGTKKKAGVGASGNASVGGKGKKGKALRVNTLAAAANVQVKQEIPDDIDLRAPMPPASPTDDPLLLSGPPEVFSSSPRREREVSVHVQTEMEEEEEPEQMYADEEEDVQEQEPMPTYEDDVLPPSSSPEPPLDTDEAEAVTAFEWEQAEVVLSTEDSMMQLDDPGDADVAPVRLFDSAAGGWSDSDSDEAEEGEGEYTGKWRMMKVRTKLDPPSSATKSRQDLWGRPISPFPKMGRLQEDDDDEEERQVREMSMELEQEVQLPDLDVQEEEEVREMSMELEEEPIVEPQEETIQIQAPDDDESSSDSDNEPGLVKITSADPRAAARAVAILKQHDYDCYTKLIKRRRHSDLSVNDHAKESRRRDVLGAGVTKHDLHQQRRRRSTLGMGIIGDKVFIPGTPVTTLPELLQVAEKEVGLEVAITPRKSFPEGLGARDPFKTPLPDRRLSMLRAELPRGVRDWAKDDWKLLDACFTDQRLELAQRDGELAPVDNVAVEDVVARFVDIVGGQSLVDTFGDAWDRDSLMERTRALQRKQRSGNVAPPTTPYTPFSFTSPSTRPSISSITTPALGGKNRQPTMEVPDFTPISLHRNRTSMPPPRRSTSSFSSSTSSLSKRPILPPPVANAPFANLPPTPEKLRKRGMLPGALMNPRYSHLLEEAVAVSLGLEGRKEDEDEDAHCEESEDTAREQETSIEVEDDSRVESTSFDVSQDHSQDLDEEEEQEEDQSKDFIGNSSHYLQRYPTPQRPSTLTTRVKGFFTSYLPTLKGTGPSSAPAANSKRYKITQGKQGLPLPPLDILTKPRGPVTTPARAPIPRVPHPKELVALNHLGLPIEGGEKEMRKREEPKRMVELVHVPFPEEREREREGRNDEKVVPRPRRSSGSSVKDLVRGFEKMDEGVKKAVRMNGGGIVKKAGSMGDLKKVWRAGQPDTRPKWKF